MESAKKTPVGYGQQSANLPELHTPSPGALVRILSGDLHGWEGTVVCRRGDDRLLIKLQPTRGGIWIEIDAQMIEILDGPEC